MIYFEIEKQDVNCYTCADKLFNKFCLIIFRDFCVKHEREEKRCQTCQNENGTKKRAMLFIFKDISLL